MTEVSFIYLRLIYSCYYGREFIFNIDNNCIYSLHLCNCKVGSLTTVQTLQQWHHSAPCCTLKKHYRSIKQQQRSTKTSGYFGQLVS